MRCAGRFLVSLETCFRCAEFLNPNPASLIGSALHGVAVRRDLRPSPAKHSSGTSRFLHIDC